MRPKLRRLAWPTNLFYTIWSRSARKSQNKPAKYLYSLTFTAILLLGFIPFAHSETPPDADQSSDISSSNSANELHDEDEDDIQIDDSRLIFWSIRSSDSSNSQASTKAIEVLRTDLKEALSGELSRHLLNEKQFREHVAHTSAPLPLCLIGLEPCVTPETLAFDALNLSLVIHVRLRVTNSAYEADYEIVDRRGIVSRTGTAQSNTARALAFDLVRTIFDATGTLAFQSTPRGAVVEIDGKAIGVTPISQNLPVGSYQVRLVLNDFEPFEVTAEVSSAQTSVIQDNLRPLRSDSEDQDSSELGAFQSASKPTPGFFNTVSHDAIALNIYGARLSYDFTFQSTTFRNARGEYQADEFEFRGFTEQGILPGNRMLDRLVTPHGPRLELFYAGENIGLTLLSLSYLQSAPGLEAMLERRSDRQEIQAVVTKLQRFQLRPFQLSYRMFFGNIVPVAEAGIGINFQWIRLRDDQLPQPITLSQTEAFWTAGLGIQYFFNSQISAQLRYNLQNYFNDGLGAEHMFNFGVGMLFGNVFGFEAEPPGKL